MKTPSPTTPTDGDSQRIAKVIARAGLCSRREAEAWIAEGRVALNGRVLDSPAVTVGPADEVTVDGRPLPKRDRTRLWLFHKPRGLVTTTRDPEGRPTVFDVLPADLPRVMTVGRLDINTEGLLLLTNDGGLARVLELPATGWLRRYRVRAHGDIDQARLDALRDGIAVDGVLYGAIEATLDRRQGDNSWLTMGLREGKNREIKNVLTQLGLDVNRLIRLSFGPFQLGDLAEGAVAEVPRRHLLEQLGTTLVSAAGADFEVREDERKPKMPKAPARPEPVEPPSRTRHADAGRNRRRHEADIDRNAEPEAAGRLRPRLGLGKGRAAEAAQPSPGGRQVSRRDLLEQRRSGAPRAEAVVERKPRRPADPPEAETGRGKARSGLRPRDGAPRHRREDAEPGRGSRGEGRSRDRTAAGADRRDGRPSEDRRPRERSGSSGWQGEAGRGRSRPQGEGRSDERGRDRNAGPRDGRSARAGDTPGPVRERDARPARAGAPGGKPRGPRPGGDGMDRGVGHAGPRADRSGGKPRGGTGGPARDGGDSPTGGRAGRDGGGKPHGATGGRSGTSGGTSSGGGFAGKPRGPAGSRGDRPGGPGGGGRNGPGGKPRGPAGGGQGGGRGADRRR